MHRSHSASLLLIAGLVCLLNITAPPAATGQVSTVQGASLLLFPKVLADGTWDTTIQIANTTLQLRRARCFYVHGDPESTPITLPRPLEFDVWLTARQPTHWVASRGRRADPTDPLCDRGNLDCDGAGFDPGSIPALPPGFRGYVACVETDASGFPAPGNALVGKATLTEIDTGDITTYTAVGFRGLDSNDMGSVLCLGGEVSPECPAGAEYHGCPATWTLQHATAGSVDPVAGEGSEVDTTIAVVPCSQDLTRNAPTATVVQFIVVNEFEQPFSASMTVTLWADISLAAISGVFENTVIGSAVAQTQMRPAGSDPGFVVIAQTHRNAAGATTSTAVNLHAEGTRLGTDLVRVPLDL